MIRGNDVVIPSMKPEGSLHVVCKPIVRERSLMPGRDQIGQVDGRLPGIPGLHGWIFAQISEVNHVNC